MEVLTAANNLAVRYLANKALQKEEALKEAAAIEDIMAQWRYCFTCAGKRCKDECLYNIFEEGMPEWKKATARAAREDHEVGIDVKDEASTATPTRSKQEEHRSPGTFYPRSSHVMPDVIKNLHKKAEVRIRTPGQPPAESYSGPTNSDILSRGPPVVSFQNEPISQLAKYWGNLQ